MSNPIEGITEADIADYLAANPSFFERHAELLHHIQLSHPLGHRTVSLQERQAEMLRERIKGLERKIIEMIRAGTENLGHFEKLQAWTLALMQVAEPAELPERLQTELRERFQIPQTALRLFHQGGCSEDVQRFAASLTEPFCGPNEGFEAARWLAEPVASLALIPLRRAGETAAEPSTFGLLVLGSPDATRYRADMGTEFLQRVGEVSSAALVRSLPVDVAQP
ncbi:hypothetical protein HNQ51_003699 [Inhella inkyongensis]|uniref:DUF484 family protein n=1 Tax=Inhella inkyongensis TaxID=392593 RepID=A0A840S9P2_9BURK|nr:DUF484 family protein [Inhella inkyongensis]MBB5206353.1 hypothetical protein [Inhella inkyongensis]